MMGHEIAKPASWADHAAVPSKQPSLSTAIVKLMPKAEPNAPASEAERITAAIEKALRAAGLI